MSNTATVDGELDLKDRLLEELDLPGPLLDPGVALLDGHDL